MKKSKHNNMKEKSSDKEIPYTRARRKEKHLFNMEGSNSENEDILEQILSGMVWHG